LKFLYKISSDESRHNSLILGVVKVIALKLAMCITIFDLYYRVLWNSFSSLARDWRSARNALSEREHTLSTYIYFSPFVLSGRAPANYKFGTCTDMFTVRRLYFIINGITRERRLARTPRLRGFLSRARERGIKLIFLPLSRLVMTRTIIGFNGRLV